MTDAPHIAVHQAGIVAVGQGLTLAQGVFKGDVVNEFGVVIGLIAWPDAGGVAIRGPGVSYDWSVGQLDSDSSGFVDGSDKDLWDWWFWWGSPMADFDASGFTNGEDKDAHDLAWTNGL